MSKIETLKKSIGDVKLASEAIAIASCEVKTLAHAAAIYIGNDAKYNKTHGTSVASRMEHFTSCMSESLISLDKADNLVNACENTFMFETMAQTVRTLKQTRLDIILLVAKSDSLLREMMPSEAVKEFYLERIDGKE